MNDLISRKAVLDIILGELNLNCGYDAAIALFSVKKCVSELPTAYNVEKVMEQIHKDLYVFDIPSDIVDDIVRKGGVNGE